MTIFCPVFEKEGNKLILPYPDFVADNKSDAYNIGFAALPEAVLFQMTFTGETVEVDLKNIPHRPARIGEVDVCVIGGPLFEEDTAA